MVVAHSIGYLRNFPGSHPIAGSVNVKSVQQPNLRFIVLSFVLLAAAASPARAEDESPRERISVDEEWHFRKFRADEEADRLAYDLRPKVKGNKDDAKLTESDQIGAPRTGVLKPWLLPTG